jgi:hypothetical protein
METQMKQIKDDKTKKSLKKEITRRKQELGV